MWICTRWRRPKNADRLAAEFPTNKQMSNMMRTDLFSSRIALRLVVGLSIAMALTGCAEKTEGGAEAAYQPHSARDLLFASSRTPPSAASEPRTSRGASYTSLCLPR